VGADERKEENFVFDADRGILTNKWTETRLFMLGATGWSSLRKDLESVYLEGGLDILKRFGYAFGRNLGRIGKEKGLDLAGLFGALSILGNGAGWGKVTLGSGNLSLGRGAMRLENCVFCSEIGQKHEPSCEFVAGVVAGFAEVATGMVQAVEETECMATGGRFCEFSFREKDPLDQESLT
jgi:predicted hydrocarbon binding protein